MMIPRSEHPNPQFMRENWLNLNGEWDFQFDNSVSGKERKIYETENGFDKKITVPFCPESQLSGIGNTDFINCVWYKKTFTVPERHIGKKVLLHFDAVDYEATVYVNKKEVGTHKGGYISFNFDITSYLTKGENTICLCAEDDSRNPLIPSGKQSENYQSNGCFYTRTTGIWQTVWLEFLPNEYIKAFKFYPNEKNCSLDIEVDVCGKGTVEALVLYDDKIMGADSTITDSGNAYLHLSLKEKHLWSIGDGNLYDVQLKFCDDKVNSYFGLRSVSLDGFKFMLNGKSVFQRLVLDQGFYPDGIYTAPTDEALENDICLSMSAGFNGARLHEKIFEPRFLYHCDKAGYIVWGEYPNWGLDAGNDNAIFSILPEWTEEINRDFNHPSIIGWCPFNETWNRNGKEQKDDLLEAVYTFTKNYDRTRPCIDTSGNFHVKTDIFDLHDYEQNPEIFKANYDRLVTDGELFDNHSGRQTYNGEAVFISEYGGIQWNELSERNNDSWGYGNAPKTEEEFIARYKGLTEAIINNEKMFGLCYTQLYDVEQEQNGLYTYQRKPKFDMNEIKKITSEKAKIED